MVDIYLVPRGTVYVITCTTSEIIVIFSNLKKKEIKNNQYLCTWELDYEVICM